MSWLPQSVLFTLRTYSTATETVFVQTDAGPGYLKALGNRGGPHLLAAEWVATHLARWLGLPTFDFAILKLDETNEVHLGGGKLAENGPAFITREMAGEVWGGGAEGLQNLSNPADIGRLVLFDTWTRNWDRYLPEGDKVRINLNNVFFSYEGQQPGQKQLIAMDHTHCFNWGNGLNARLGRIDLVKDDRIYGLFPDFVPYVESAELSPVWKADVERLSTLDRSWVTGIVAAIPAAWGVDAAGREALIEQICQRASYLHRQFPVLIEPLL